MEDGIKVWDYGKLKIQKQLGRGTFGTVYLAHCDEPEVTNPVVMKVMHQSLAVGDVARKLFMKEAKLLTGLHHENIVRMYGICMDPLTIIMEYVVFDFRHQDIKVNTLDMFLSEIAQMSKTEDNGFDHLIPKIAVDVAKGLLHLHEHEIVHRDLKPMNILISNQHYSALQDWQHIRRIKAVRPVVCKLADFGESRSQLLQTTGLNDPGTNQVFRGTIPFMAPEILLPEAMVPGKKLSLDDLKKVDIWALGLVFYCLINPGDLCPYKRDGYQLPIDIINLQRQRKRPSCDPEYHLKQSTVWVRVRDVTHACTNHDPVERPRASEVVNALCSPRAAQFQEAVTTHTQWYSGDEGNTKLQSVLKDLMEIVLGNVDMSRDTRSQDISLSFVDRFRRTKWEIMFPAKFPVVGALLIQNPGTGKEKKQRRKSSENASKAVKNMVSYIKEGSWLSEAPCSPDTKEDPIPREDYDNPPRYPLAVEQPNLPHPVSRAAQFLKMVTTDTQWYSGDEGNNKLQSVLKDLMEIVLGDVDMSRDTRSHDISLSFVDRYRRTKWEIRFPAKFPVVGALLIQNPGTGQEKKQRRRSSENASKAVKNMVCYIKEGSWLSEAP